MTARLSLALALLLAGCGGTATPPPGRLASVSPTHAVPWADYAPGIQARIDGLKAAKDCDPLQAEFNTADRNDAATRTRTGHGNADLMGYIDAALRAAGCY